MGDFAFGGALLRPLSCTSGDSNSHGADELTPVAKAYKATVRSTLVLTTRRLFLLATAFVLATAFALFVDALRYQN